MRRLVHGLFLAAHLLLALLFLLGYGARYVHPAYTWWAELIAVGLPYLSAAVIAAAGVAALARWWRLAALHLALAVLIAVRFAPPLGLDEPNARPGDLTVMSFNVPRWGYALDDKTRGIAALVRREQPELIGFQDAYAYYDDPVSLFRRISTYLRPVTDSLHYAVADAYTGEPVITQPVLARGAELLGQEHIPLDGPEGERLRQSAVAENDPALGKTTVLVRTRFRWQEREAVLYNLHLQTFGARKPWREGMGAPLNLAFWRRYARQFRASYRIRAWEAEQVRAILEEETRPFIVTGDLNSTPHSWVYRMLTADLQDAFYLAGDGWGATYHSRLPFARIDYVLASEEWEVVSAHVPGVQLSDHRPVVARLRFVEGSGTSGG